MSTIYLASCVSDRSLEHGQNCGQRGCRSPRRTTSLPAVRTARRGWPFRCAGTHSRSVRGPWRRSRTSAGSDTVDTADSSSPGRRAPVVSFVCLEPVTLRTLLTQGSGAGGSGKEVSTLSRMWRLARTALLQQLTARLGRIQSFGGLRTSSIASGEASPFCNSCSSDNGNEQSKELAYYGAPVALVRRCCRSRQRGWSGMDARRTAARAPPTSASEAGRVDRADPPAYLCRVLLVHVEKVGHRRTDWRNGRVVKGHPNLAMEDLEQRAVEVFDHVVLVGKALVDEVATDRRGAAGTERRMAAAAPLCVACVLFVNDLCVCLCCVSVHCNMQVEAMAELITTAGEAETRQIAA